MSKTMEFFIQKGHQEFKEDADKKLSKELKALRDKKTEEYGPFNKKMQNIADIWTVLVGKKIRPHQVALDVCSSKDCQS